MNDRWSELAEECWDERIDGYHFDQEMFTELIIKECIKQGDTLAKHYIDTHPEQEQVMLLASIADYSNEIKQHFGVESEPKPVGNTLTFMTRAIFNVVAKHQEKNGGYFIADGDVDDFVGRLAKVINSTFEPLKPRG